jgi:hypothetical protein
MIDSTKKTSIISPNLHVLFGETNSVRPELSTTTVRHLDII